MPVCPDCDYDHDAIEEDSIAEKFSNMKHEAIANGWDDVLLEIQKMEGDL